MNYISALIMQNPKNKHNTKKANKKKLHGQHLQLPPTTPTTHQQQTNNNKK
jgi:hypothetical protein